MKRLLFLVPVILLLGTVGCKPSVNPPTAPAAGYVDSYDQQFAQIIAAGEAFYRSIQNDVNAKTYTPSPTELTSLNAFGVALNVAKGAAQQYKAQQTPQNLAAAQSATNAVKSQQSTLSAQIPAGVK